MGAVKGFILAGGKGTGCLNAVGYSRSVVGFSVSRSGGDLGVGVPKADKGLRLAKCVGGILAGATFYREYNMYRTSYPANTLAVEGKRVSVGPTVYVRYRGYCRIGSCKYVVNDEGEISRKKINVDTGGIEASNISECSAFKLGRS